MMIFLIVCASLIAAPSLLAQDTKTHTVVEGDTLWDISQKYYDNPYLWPALWALNKDALGNAHQISAGDVLVIYPKEKLVERKMAAEMREKMVAAPKPPKEEPESLYEKSQPLESFFPEYFTYLANPKGIQNTGITRIRVKKMVTGMKWVVGPDNQVRGITTKKILNTLVEIREVAEIIASMDRGYTAPDSGDIHGRSMLSTYDDVLISFSEDVAQILESYAHGEADPYFRSYPIYSMGAEVKELRDPKLKQSLGTLVRYKGKLTVVARIETSKVMSPKQLVSFRKERTYNREPVFYVARIVLSKEPIEIGDKVFLFKRIE